MHPTRAHASFVGVSSRHESGELGGTAEGPLPDQSFQILERSDAAGDVVKRRTCGKSVGRGHLATSRWG